MVKKSKALVYMPIILFFVLHIIGSYEAEAHISFGSDIFRAVLMSVLAFALGEGYGILSFINANMHDRTSLYVITIMLCITSGFACLVGYFITGIESYNCKWMTVCLVLLNVGVLVASEVQLIKRE